MPRTCSRCGSRRCWRLFALGRSSPGSTVRRHGHSGARIGALHRITRAAALDALRFFSITYYLGTASLMRSAGEIVTVKPSSRFTNVPYFDTSNNDIVDRRIMRSLAAVVAFSAVLVSNPAVAQNQAPKTAAQNLSAD